MTAEPAHTVRILEAAGGAPLEAACTCGAWAWTRPAGDRWADTLPPAARAHRLAAELELEAARDAGDAAAELAAELESAGDDD